MSLMKLFIFIFFDIMASDFHMTAQIYHFLAFKVAVGTLTDVISIISWNYNGCYDILTILNVDFAHSISQNRPTAQR